MKSKGEDYMHRHLPGLHRLPLAAVVLFLGVPVMQGEVLLQQKDGAELPGTVVGRDLNGKPTTFRLCNGTVVPVGDGTVDEKATATCKAPSGRGGVVDQKTDKTANKAAEISE